MKEWIMWENSLEKKREHPPLYMLSDPTYIINMPWSVILSLFNQVIIFSSSVQEEIKGREIISSISGSASNRPDSRMET